MNRKPLKLVISALLALWLAGCATTPAPESQSASVTSIGVALYPHVPRPAQFQQVIQAAWQTRHPSVSLTFFTAAQWDGGYKKEPPAGADLFVFDSIYLNHYRVAKWLLPLAGTDIEGLNDFLPYAINGVQFQGAYYGIPMLGCTNMLFYRRGDQALANANSFSAVSSALGRCTYTSQIPPDSTRGWMTDLAGGTTNACTYIDITQRLTGNWPVTQPYKPEDLFKPAITGMHVQLEMASWYNATDDSLPQYTRSGWFSRGHGRAVVGFTESMSAMDPATLEAIEFKILPLSNQTEQPLFYADIIGINARSVTPDKRALVLELANLIASTSVMTASIGPDDSGIPQYLMPTRQSIFDTLAPRFPKYAKMQSIVSSTNPILFTLDGDAKPWIEAMKGPIKSLSRQNFACGCDFAAGPLWNQQDAQDKCPAVCQPHGGWNSQWTTTVPGRASACGCNSCPLR